MPSKKKHAIIIVNPCSGSRRGKQVANKVVRELSSHYDIETYITQESHKTSDYVKNRLSDVDGVFVVGGDGTINDVLQSIAGSHVPMGVFPSGSGNAAAFEMGIRTVHTGIRNILSQKVRSIDCGKLNGRYFINVAGIGFDSSVASDFQTRKYRGLIGYLLASWKQIPSYRPVSLTFNTKGKVWKEKVFMASIANVRQIGNDALIAPMARPNDGVLDLCILRPFPHFLLPDMGLKLFLGKLEASSYYSHNRFKKLRVEGNFKHVHLDGELVSANGVIEVSVVPDSVKIFGA